MSYVYKNFRDNKDIDAFFNLLNNALAFPIETWHKENGLVLYGYIDNENSELPNYAVICYGRTLTSDEVAKLPKVGIFASIKSYGSSKKFKGLRDIRGKILIEAQYDEILPLCEYDNDVLLIVKRNNLCGLVKYSAARGSVEVVVPARFEKIFDAQEYTIGFVENGLVGFMDLEGNVVIPAIFQDIDGNNIFINGKAEILKACEHCVPYYINHYGNPVEDAYVYQNDSEHQLGTGYYPYGDLPSVSDAYEGDSDARWNTD